MTIGRSPFFQNSSGDSHDWGLFVSYQTDPKYFPRHDAALLILLSLPWQGAVRDEGAGQEHSKETQEPELGIVIGGFLFRFFFFFHSFNHLTTSLQQGLLYDEVTKMMSLLGRTLQTETVECGDGQSAVWPCRARETPGEVSFELQLEEQTEGVGKTVQTKGQQAREPDWE